MRTYFKLFLMVGTLIFASCEKEVENWSTEAVEYAGKFITKYYDGKKLIKAYNTNQTVLYVSNTATNTDKQIFVKANYMGIQSKFDIAGTPAEFKSVSSSFAKAHNNLLAIGVPGTPPTSASDVISDDRANVKVAIVSASIKKGGYTTAAGNVTDKFDMTIKSYGGTVSFKAKVKPKEKWVKPNVPEYEWILDKIVEYPAANKTYRIEGFRHTGFHEDDIK